MKSLFGQSFTDYNFFKREPNSPVFGLEGLRYFCFKGGDGKRLSRSPKLPMDIWVRWALYVLNSNIVKEQSPMQYLRLRQRNPNVSSQEIILHNQAIQSEKQAQALPVSQRMSLLKDEPIRRGSVTFRSDLEGFFFEFQEDSRLSLELVCEFASIIIRDELTRITFPIYHVAGALCRGENAWDGINLKKNFKGWEEPMKFSKNNTEAKSPLPVSQFLASLRLMLATEKAARLTGDAATYFGAARSLVEKVEQVLSQQGIQPAEPPKVGISQDEIAALLDEARKSISRDLQSKLQQCSDELKKLESLRQQLAEREAAIQVEEKSIATDRDTVNTQRHALDVRELRLDRWEKQLEGRTAVPTISAEEQAAFDRQKQELQAEKQRLQIAFAQNADQAAKLAEKEKELENATKKLEEEQVILEALAHERLERELRDAQKQLDIKIAELDRVIAEVKAGKELSADEISHFRLLTLAKRLQPVGNGRSHVNGNGHKVNGNGHH